MTKHIRPVSKAAMEWTNTSIFGKLGTILSIVSSLAPLIQLISEKQQDGEQG